jgi:hypothetical protein
VDFVAQGKKGGKLRSVILVHGDPGPQKILTELLARGGMDAVHAPAAGERLAL